MTSKTASREKLLGYGEGFYGRPHAWEDRHHIVEVLASEGLNAYVYAPKNDPYHRDRWREPYPEDELAHFRQVIQDADSQGVSFCFSISPLGMTFSDPQEFETLWAKVLPFLDMGIRDVGILFDDVPEVLSAKDRGKFENLGQAHGVTAAKLFEKLAPLGVRLAVAPTEYTGHHTSPYLQHLARELPSEVAIAWTGRFVVSPVITPEEVTARQSALGHPILIWDNFPVNDGPMGIWCHLGPWQGREWGVVQAAAGLFVNGMEQARASMVGLRQLGELVREKDAFDPLEAWKRACYKTGAGAEEDFFVVAEQMADSACHPTPSPTLWALLDELETSSDAQVPAIRSRIAGELERQSKALAKVRKSLEDKRLLDEVSPWVDQMARNLTAMSTLVSSWEAAKPEDSEGRMTAEQMFGVIAAILQRIQPGGPGKAVHGASWGFRAVVETVSEGWRISPDAIVKNSSAVDRLFVLALQRLCLPENSDS